MSRNETRSSQFGLVSGIRQPSSDLVLVAEPSGLFAPESRKGQLYIVTDVDQDVARSRDACQLITRTIRKLFYEDSSYSVTSALRKAISAANQALYQHNFNASSQKRTFVGATCAVIKGNDLYIAQIVPTQAYILAEGKLRALPSNLSWNPQSAGVVQFIKPGALGSSLSIEPEFYRAVLRPGDALLLCSSNLSRLLGRDEVMRLLRSSEPADIVERLLELCKQHGLTEAHGLAISTFAPLSPVAQASPFSRAGLGERGWVALRGVGDWAARITGELTLLVQGPGARSSREKRQVRRERERREDAQLSTLPEEPTHTPTPAPVPLPLDLGESLDECVARERREGRTASSSAQGRRQDLGELPPSAFLGEGHYMPPPPVERRIDLSDTPGMAVLGHSARPQGHQPLPVELTFSERVSRSIDRVLDLFTSLDRRRRRRRLPPRALRQVRRQQGLSYRRQGPPFPWQWLLILVSLVSILILYGINQSRENTLQQADTALVTAEKAVAAVRQSSDDISAQRQLEAAAVAIEEVRATGSVTATQENRRRFDELQREYERALAAIQKVTYFNDLAVIATHPMPGAVFGSVVVPPTPQGITNTAAFNWIYALDTNAGVLYRMPRNGGALQPLLRPEDRFGALNVGKIKAQAWRFDNIVAVAQSIEAGPFTFYFRNNESWSYSNLAGSEEWGQVDNHFRAVNYEGNLYIWGASPGNVLRYNSGEYGNFPLPWIQNDGQKKVDSSIDLAVDGKIYLLQPDGRILIFATNDAGERAFEREIAPPVVSPLIVTVTGFFVSGDAAAGSIYLLDSYNRRIIQIDKQTGALIQQIYTRPETSIQLDQLTNMFVDEGVGRPVLYLINGSQILRGALPDRPRPFRDTTTPTATGFVAPTVAPTLTP